MKYLVAGLVMTLFALVWSCDEEVKKNKVSGSCLVDIKAGDSDSTFKACFDYTDVEDKEKDATRVACQDMDDHKKAAGTWNTTKCVTTDATAKCTFNRDQGTQVIYIFDTTWNDQLKPKQNGLCPAGATQKVLKEAKKVDASVVISAKDPQGNEVKMACHDFIGIADGLVDKLEAQYEELMAGSTQMSAVWATSACDTTEVTHQCTGTQDDDAGFVANEYHYNLEESDVGEKEGECEGEWKKL